MTESRKIEQLETQLKKYEENGMAKLYYSLNKKMNEMADLMNRHDLAILPIDDPKDKTFDRLKVIWADASSIALAVKSLGEVAGVTGNEKADVEKKPFVETIAEARK
jgi:hypothetical protein